MTCGGYGNNNNNNKWYNTNEPILVIRRVFERKKFSPATSLRDKTRPSSSFIYYIIYQHVYIYYKRPCWLDMDYRVCAFTRICSDLYVSPKSWWWLYRDHTHTRIRTKRFMTNIAGKTPTATTYFIFFRLDKNIIFNVVKYLAVLSTHPSPRAHGYGPPPRCCCLDTEQKNFLLKRH